MDDTLTTAEDAVHIDDIKKELHAPEKLSVAPGSNLPEIKRENLMVFRLEDECPECDDGELWKDTGSAALWCINPDCRLSG